MVLGFIKTSRLIFLFLILVSSAYSPKISKHFEHNNYIRNYSVHVINDSLQLYFKSPADINYITESEELKNAIQNTGFKLKDKAILKAKQHAEKKVEPLNQKVGKAIHISVVQHIENTEL